MKINFDDSNSSENIYRFTIKANIIILQNTNFENFLKNQLEGAPAISPDELFQFAIFDCLLAVDYAISEKDDDLLYYINILIKKLEDEQEQSDEENISLAKIFARLLKKSKNVCEAGLSISEIMLTFEFRDTLKTFKEKVVEKASVGSKQSSEIYTSRYSNN